MNYCFVHSQFNLLLTALVPFNISLSAYVIITTSHQAYINTSEEAFACIADAFSFLEIV
jgi:hypothetical protein